MACNNEISDRDISSSEEEDDEEQFLESEFSSDDGKSVDILSTSEEKEKEDSSCEGSAAANKFSIDNILGLNKKSQKNKNENCEKSADNKVRFIKPTPVQAALRTGQIYLLI